MIYLCVFIPATAFQRVVVAYERLKGHTPPRPAAATATAQTSGDVSPFGWNRLFCRINWLLGFQFQVSFFGSAMVFFAELFQYFLFLHPPNQRLCWLQEERRAKSYLGFYRDVLDATGNGVTWDIVNYPPDRFSFPDFTSHLPIWPISLVRTVGNTKFVHIIAAAGCGTEATHSKMAGESWSGRRSNDCLVIPLIPVDLLIWYFWSKKLPVD